MAENTKSVGNSEPLVFINECLPQLAAGKYTVSADLVAETSTFDKVTKEFWVDGPRFIIPQSDIYTVYPPKDASGRFETTLPHVVFNRRTLPWERTIDGAGHADTKFRSGPSQAVAHAPWMGLLLLSENEMNGAQPGDKIVMQQRILSDIFDKKDDKVFVPEINGGKGLSVLDDPKSGCETIDIPTQLFKTILPKKDDLLFLGHVRKVELGRNKESADIDDDGYFATLVANRLPVRNSDIKKANRNTVFLVSLEGFQNHYANPAYIKQPKVRLIVLTSWSFTVSEGKNFRELCNELHVSPLKMNAPVADPDLKQAYNYGYALLPHTTRNGVNTFSWYRGPLNPNFLPAMPNNKTFSSADEALRFDHNTGLFDISYAAAWQLGRVLALKDKIFSTALYQWKMQEKKNTGDSLALKNLAALFPKDHTPSRSVDANSAEELVKDFLAQHYDPSAPPGPAIAFDSIIKNEQEDLKAARQVQANPIPKEITDWLGKLFVLQGVPINYLIPHERYLVNNNMEQEALGTFYIDYAWVEALLGGALSIVNPKDSEMLLGMLKDGRFLPKNIKDNKKDSKDLPKKEGEAVPMPAPTSIPGHITGFLLRSQLVSGWKGIKIFQKDPSGNWMEDPLRIERIAEDINLCIFSGKVQEILFIQPPEGIHFGVSVNNKDSALVKYMRDTDGTVNEANRVDVKFTDKNKGVIDMEATAGAMSAAVKAGPYSSANLAFQMLESPIVFSLKIKD